MSGVMDCSGATDIGKKRSVNEDQFLVADVSKSMRVHQTSLALDHQTRLFGETQAKILLVADGLGGHEAGERASQLVVDGIVDYVLNRLNWFMCDQSEDEEEFESELKKSLLACQERINREMSAIPQRRGMGSTLTMGYITWPKMFLLHVGDSRCYLLRDGKLQRLTRDHTIGELNRALEDADVAPQGSVGRIEEHSERQPEGWSHVLWNVIGGTEGDAPHPDATALNLQLGDSLLFCTDGLSNPLEPQKLQSILEQGDSAADTCRKLVSTANQASGADNITAIVAKFVESSSDKMSLQAAESLQDCLEDTADHPPAKEKPAVVSS